MVPSSLLACMTETSTVSGRSARRTSSGSTRQSGLTRRRVISTPSRSNCSQGPSTAGCSTALTMACLAAPGENQGGGLAANQGRKLAAGRFHALFGALPEMVDAGSITVHLTETRRQGFQHFWSDGRCGIVVEIEALHEKQLSAIGFQLQNLSILAYT